MRMRLVGVLLLAILLFLFAVSPSAVGLAILLFPLALIIRSKIPATSALVLIGICLVLMQFIGAKAYAYLTGIIGLVLAIMIVPPWSQLGIGLLISVIGVIIQRRRIPGPRD